MALERGSLNADAGDIHELLTVQRKDENHLFITYLNLPTLGYWSIGTKFSL